MLNFQLKIIVCVGIYTEKTVKSDTSKDTITQTKYVNSIDLIKDLFYNE